MKNVTMKKSAITDDGIAIMPPQSIRRSRTAGFAPSTLALAISGALMANVATADDNSIALDKLKIEESVTPDTNPYAVPGAPYLAERVSDPRRTRSLAETPPPKS